MEGCLGAGGLSSRSWGGEGSVLCMPARPCPTARALLAFLVWSHACISRDGLSVGRFGSGIFCRLWNLRAVAGGSSRAGQEGVGGVMACRRAMLACFCLLLSTELLTFGCGLGLGLDWARLGWNGSSAGRGGSRA